MPVAGEEFHELARLDGARIEHIVSSATPDDAEQVQDWDEWVLVLSGSATLQLPHGRVQLVAGEWLVIGAGVPHRVLATAGGTQWLAVHGPGPSGPPRSQEA